MTAPTPINPGEAIIEPFWDPLLSGLARWAVHPGEGHGLVVRQEWCFAVFSWARRPDSGSALAMERSWDVPVSDWERLVVSINAPEGSVVTLKASTDAGERSATFPPAGALKRELAVELEGARTLLGVSIAVEARRDGGQTGWINWIGLAHPARLARYERDWRRFDASWDGYLLPASTAVSMTPAHGFLLDAEDLAALRAAPEGREHLRIGRAAAAGAAPETLINDVLLPFDTDTRYSREREHGRKILGPGLQIAVAGAIAGDAGLLRLAARYAMSILMTGSWEWGIISKLPGSSFEIRSFIQSMVVEELVLIHDLAHGFFTEPARALLERRIAEEGVGQTNFVSWRHEYIHHCNQLAAFSPGRVLGYAFLEQRWPRVRPYLELAYQELRASLEDVVLPDGGFVEGPGYLHYTISSAARALHYYARARGLTSESCTPPCVARTAAFAEAVLSTDRAQDQIPICDAGPDADLDSLAFLAAALPRSVWPTAYRAAVRRGRAEAASAFAFVAGRAAPEHGPTPRPIVSLPEMRLVSSWRAWGTRTVRLVVLGNRADAGHAHEDKGSFILECGGSTLAMDPGSCDYSHPLSLILKDCERHNMLVPYGAAERLHPKNPIPHNVEIDATGDEVRFRSAMDLAAGWEGVYRRWRREITSDQPETLQVTDTYELERGDGVDLFWNTSLPVKFEGEVVRIVAPDVVAELRGPPGAAIRVEELPLLGHGSGHGAESMVQRRVAFRVSARAGTIRLAVRLVPGRA